MAHGNPALSNRIKHLPYATIALLAIVWAMLSPADVLPLGIALDSTTIQLVTMAAFFAIIAAANRIFEPLFLCNRAVVFFCVCGFAGALIAGMLVWMQISSPPLAYLSFVAMVSFQCFFIIRCLDKFATLDMVDVLFSLLLWQLLTAVVQFLSEQLPVLPLLLATPLLSLVLCQMEKTKPPQASSSESDPDELPDKRLPWKLIVIDALVVLMIYSIRCFSPQGTLTYAHFGALIAALIVGTIIVASGRIVRMRRFYDASLVLLELTVVFYMVGQNLTFGIAGMLVDASYVTFSVFFFTVLCNLVLRYQMNATFLFSVAYLAECIAGCAGEIMTPIVKDVPDVTLWLPVFLSAITVMAFTYLSNDEDHLTSWSLNTHRKGFVDPVSYYYSIVDVCSTVAMQYGLSKRESDVLLLLAQKKTAAQIAEELVLSNATVKSHMRNIYRKLAIHSKQELFALIGRPPDKYEEDDISV